MKNVKAQLRAFYDKQGLTGKHRRKAMHYDMKAAKRNSCYPIGKIQLGFCFVFDCVPEGGRYWYERAENQYPNWREHES